jgi:protein-disulfide isomerase
VNWFAIGTSIAVVVALIVVAGIVIWSNQSATSPGEAPKAASVNSETGAITVGEGSNTLDTYIDFMCPICNQFEQIYGETIQGLVDDGSITLNIHPIAILDRYSQGTQYSTRAANAMYCVAVADGAASVPFLQAMYQNQPEEQSTGLTNDQILQIAKSVGVTGIDSCVNNGDYAKFVGAMTEKTPVQEGAGGIATPTVVLNGQILKLSGDPQADLVAPLQ